MLQILRAVVLAMIVNTVLHVSDWIIGSDIQSDRIYFDGFLSDLVGLSDILTFNIGSDIRIDQPEHRKV